MRRVTLTLAILSALLMLACIVAGTARQFLLWGQLFDLEDGYLVRVVPVPVTKEFIGDYVPLYRFRVIELAAVFKAAALVFAASAIRYLWLQPDIRNSEPAVGRVVGAIGKFASSRKGVLAGVLVVMLVLALVAHVLSKFAYVRLGDYDVWNGQVVWGTGCRPIVELNLFVVEFLLVAGILIMIKSARSPKG